ncbi:unnamed protein product [Notodromas monacha]|uniref:RRM domain-containing protein n=1 Tax=Notodromas monacha TaxID=399045 RepID=A0A7R9GFP9_9CRUS|nr:unnamed protein product [Notodromas monacha]CAG0919568.1 unnamed protein product [Notodromas monacha]
MQIALKQGSPQDYGLVEFETAEQAEITAELRHGAPFRNSKLSISYFIPGQRAINIYMKILHDHGAIRANAALLPDPTATSVAESMANMARNNPTFASNLTSIILNEIQDIQEGAFKTVLLSRPLGLSPFTFPRATPSVPLFVPVPKPFLVVVVMVLVVPHKSNNVDKPSDMFDGDQSVSDFTSNGTMFQEALAGPPIVAGGGWPRLGGAAPPPPPPAGNASEAFLNSLLEAAATSASHPPQRGLDGAGKPRNGTVGDFYAGTKLEQGKAPHQQQLLAVTGEAHQGFFPHQGFPGNPFPQYVILGDGKPNIELPLMAHHGSLPQQVASMEIDPYRGFSVVQPSWIPSVAAAGAPPPAAGLAGLHLAPAAALWPYAQMEPQMSVFAAAAAQNQLLGKRKLPAMPFGLPDHHHQQQQQHHHHHHQHQHHHQQQQQQHQQQQQQQQQQQSACFFPSQQYMIAAAAAAAQNDPYKRKRQY